MPVFELTACGQDHRIFGVRRFIRGNDAGGCELGAAFGARETIAENEALKARLDALESNEVVDDATDSSLLTLVADLTTRVTALEA